MFGRVIICFIRFSSVTGLAEAPANGKGKFRLFGLNSVPGLIGGA